MKDLYRALGISKDATLKEVKKAFMPMALNAHPDKGGDIEQWQLINNAYQTLSDPQKRHEYDDDWHAYQEADVDSVVDFNVDSYLQAGSILPYSHAFKEQHKALVIQYNALDTEPKPIKKRIIPFESNAYSYQNSFGKTVYCHDIFTFIRTQHHFPIDTGSPALSALLSEALTPVKAVKLFSDFLSGIYSRAVLNEIKHYFFDDIYNKNQLITKPAELTLYQAIVEILSMTNDMELQRHHLILSLKKSPILLKVRRIGYCKVLFRYFIILYLGICMPLPCINIGRIAIIYLTWSA